MSLGTGLGLPLPLRAINLDFPLYLAVLGDSLANRFVLAGDNLNANIAAAENFFSGVTIEGLNQGGMQTIDTWAQANGATSIYLWEDDTHEPSAKFTGLYEDITDPEAVNGVIIFLGSNDADPTLDASFGSTYTKAQYKTALAEFYAYLYETAFPNAQFIGVIRFHRNDQTAFAALTYQAIAEAQQEVIDDVAYVVPLPDIWDVDLADTVHPTGASEPTALPNAYQTALPNRIMAAIATHLGRNTGGTTGPRVTAATMTTDAITLTITHDKGTSLEVPANAKNGFRLMTGGTFSGGALTVAGTFIAPSAVTETSDTTLKLDLDSTNYQVTTNAKRVYIGYGQSEDLARTGAEVVKDNAAVPLPLRRGVIAVTDADVIRQITSLNLDINPKVGTRTLSGSDVTQFTDGTGKTFVSSSGRYANYDGAAFGGLGCLSDPDAATHYKGGSISASTTGFGGIVFEVPSGAAADCEFFSFGNNTNGSTRARLRFQISGDKLQWGTNNADVIADLKTGGVKGVRHFILWEFLSASSVNFYVNSLTPVNIDPYDSMSGQTHFWLFSRTTTNASLTGMKIARAWHKNAVRDSGNDPSISAIASFINTAYGLGLSL